MDRVYSLCVPEVVPVVKDEVSVLTVVGDLCVLPRTTDLERGVFELPGQNRRCTVADLAAGGPLFGLLNEPDKAGLVENRYPWTSA